jgi:hypothetical protein
LFTLVAFQNMTSEHTQHTPIETEYICVTSDNDEEEDDDDDAFGDYAYAPLPDDDDDDNQLDDTSVLPANDTPSEPTLPQPLRIPPPEEPISEEDAQLIRQVQLGPK